MMPISKTEAKIINYLYEHSDEGLYAAEIARELKIVKRTIYDSLDTLEQKGVVRKQIRGRMRFYTLDNKWKDVAEAAKVKLLAETDEAPSLDEVAEKVRQIERFLPFAERAFGTPIVDKLAGVLESMKKELKERKGEKSDE